MDKVLHRSAIMQFEVYWCCRSVKCFKVFCKLVFNVYMFNISYKCRLKCSVLCQYCNAIICAITLPTTTSAVQIVDIASVRHSFNCSPLNFVSVRHSYNCSPLNVVSVRHSYNCSPLNCVSVRHSYD